MKELKYLDVLSPWNSPDPSYDFFLGLSHDDHYSLYYQLSHTQEAQPQRR